MRKASNDLRFECFAINNLFSSKLKILDIVIMCEWARDISTLCPTALCVICDNNVCVVGVFAINRSHKCIYLFATEILLSLQS